MTVSYQGPAFLQKIVSKYGITIFDRAEAIKIFDKENITTDELAVFRNLKTIEMHGPFEWCKSHLSELIPANRLSHFEKAEGRCIAVLN